MNSWLITGGTGFLSHGLVRELLSRGSERICIYSRNEYRQAVMRETFKNDERLRFFIGDVRDKDRLQRAMHGVNAVIAAAALKRIEAVEYNVLEAVQTNIHGIENTVKAAIDAHVGRVVLVSTDKAVAATNCYGMTKALAEKIVLSARHYAGPGGPVFRVCRFGNVSGSTGSVIPRWREILQTSDTVPVTDPSCTRFWMPLRDAVACVLETAYATEDAVIIPTLPAYELGDLAAAMGAKMEITGLPAHEKLHEVLEPGVSSQDARRMTVEELKVGLEKDCG